ncbi:hypothetical protein JI739_15790 [Ramlibacter sp. AW1]|uniref:DUF4124 domain-containing protein n=1 Tax=Ramlibacter aurantiacus TaxID=2801330 RepID=A0A936ZSM0_9BURK|nr:hypothetical protein [Ramlibacter aurantiacus]MBL0421811.1 hypothetical protein [Ramlibacter aurantiacus]
MRLIGSALLALGCLAAGQATAQCYTVYDAGNRVLYHGRESPVDMSKPLHETVPGMYPGGHLVFDNISSCDELRPLQPVVQSARSAEPDTARMGAGPSRAARKEITELRDLKLRVTREGDNLLIEPLDH